MQKRHHDVGHLHAGIVDVILHFHRAAGGAQHAHERIAQNGVAQVSDVRGFVGIDVGVLDDDLVAIFAASTVVLRPAASSPAP